MDINKLIKVVEEHLAGSDIFVVECQCSQSNDITLILDADSRVTIDTCVAVSRAVDEVFDRDVEDFSLTVTSAGIGEPLKLLRQYQKIVGSPIEVLLKDGIKILATLDSASEQGIVVSYDEKVAVEGSKRKQTQHTVRQLSFDDIKSAKEYLDYK
jgi:ribosome maturation factor RimP